MEQSFSARRLSALRQKMGEHGASAVLVRKTSDIRWLTGFDGVFDTEQAHMLVVSADAAWLHTDSRYSAACCKAAAAAGGLVQVDAAVGSHASFAARVLGSLEGALSLDIEDDLPLCEYRGLQKAFAERDCAFNETKGIVPALRGVKDDGEILRMRQAQRITDAAFQHIVGWMRPGMAERQVQRELEAFMLDHGAEALSFSSIVATGENGASPHAIPGDAVLEAGQCVVIDFGCVYQGYCSDMTRTVFLGKSSPFMKHAYEAIRAANEEVERMLRPGVTGKAAHELACQVLADAGFAGKMGHGLGHGVGLDVHEQPNLNSRNDQPLAPGNVVTVEPGIYLAAGDGLLAGKATDGGDHAPFGMRLEDFGVITADGFDVFTQSSHDAVII